MKERKLYIDFIRIIAVYFVIINHTDWQFGKFGELDGYSWGISAIFYFIAKTGVPLFIMITGTLSLGKIQDYKKISTKILKTIFIIIIWSALFRIFYSKSLINIGEINSFIKDIIREPVATHLWYLYMLVGLYFMLPFLQKMVERFKTIDYCIFLTIWSIYSSLLPFLRIFHDLPYSTFFNIPMFYGYLGFLILGYFLDSIIINKKVITLAWISFLVSLISMYVITLHFSIIYHKTSYILDNNITFPVAIMSAALFIIIKNQVLDCNNKLATRTSGGTTRFVPAT